MGLGSLDLNTFGYPSGTPLLPFSIAIGLISSRLDRRVCRSAACQGARKNVRNELLTILFVGRWIILVGAPRSSQDLVLERSVQRSMQWCVCGGVICSGVPKTLYCSDVRSKGRLDISILILVIYPKPRPVAQAHGKVKMGAERPISTPHLGVYSPPQNAPSITWTIPDITLIIYPK